MSAVLQLRAVIATAAVARIKGLTRGEVSHLSRHRVVEDTRVWAPVKLPHDRLRVERKVQRQPEVVAHVAPGRGAGVSCGGGAAAVLVHECQRPQLTRDFAIGTQAVPRKVRGRLEARRALQARFIPELGVRDGEVQLRGTALITAVLAAAQQHLDAATVTQRARGDPDHPAGGWLGLAAAPTELHDRAG